MKRKKYVFSNTTSEQRAKIEKKKLLLLLLVLGYYKLYNDISHKNALSIDCNN